MRDPTGDPTIQRCGGCGQLRLPGEAPSAHAQCQRTIVLPESAVDRSRLEPGMPTEVRDAAIDAKNILNQYVLVSQLGKGGMGTVWKAYDRSLSRWVAIKFLTAPDDESIRRFQREARLAAGLHHPNIAPVHEIGQVRDQYFIVMELIAGVSIDRLKVPMDAMIGIFVKICAAMEAAHQGGVVHRDLKPQNIMVTHQGSWPFVMDFGLAKGLQTDDSVSASGTILGSPAYMPPEQASGLLDEIDARSDVYAIGATLYTVLARRQPFIGATIMETLMKVCNEEPDPPRKHNTEIPESLQNIIMKAMSKDKAARYESAAALGADLQRFVEGGDVLARPQGAMTLLLRKARRNAWPLIAAGALIAAAAIYVGGSGRRPPTAPAAPPAPPVVIPVDAKTFTLKIALSPFAKIESIVYDGKVPVELPDGHSPIVLKDLKVGDYEITYSHDSVGERKFRVTAAELEHGRTYFLSGNVADPKFNAAP